LSRDTLVVYSRKPAANLVYTLNELDLSPRMADLQQEQVLPDQQSPKTRNDASRLDSCYAANDTGTQSRACCCSTGNSGGDVP